MERMRIWGRIVTVEIERGDDARNGTEMASGGVGNQSNVRRGRRRNQVLSLQSGR